MIMKDKTMKKYSSILIFISMLLIISSGCINDGEKTAVPEGAKEERTMLDGGNGVAKTTENAQIELHIDSVEYGPYKTVSIKDVGGKLFQSVEEDGKWFIIYGEKKMGPYDYIGSPEDFGGKFLCTVEKDGNRYRIYDGMEMGPYDDIGPSKDFGGKLVYIAKKEGEFFIVYDGEKMETEYDSIDYLMNIGGKLTYVAGKNGKEFVVYDGREIGPYDVVGSPFKAGGNPIITQLAFSAFKGNGKYEVCLGEKLEDGNCFIVYDTKVMGPYPNYRQLFGAYNPPSVDIAGTLAFEVTKNIGEKIIVYDGKEIGPYDSVGSLTNVSDKLAFIALKNNRYFVFYDGEEKGPYYWVSHLEDVGGKLAFIVKKDNGERFTVYDGKVIGAHYDLIYVGGKLAYVDVKDGKCFIVYDGTKNGPYDRVDAPKDLGGKLFFEARKGDKLFVVFDGKEAETVYDIVDHPMNVGGKLAYTAHESYEQLDQQLVVYGGREMGPYGHVGTFVDVSGKLACTVSKDGKWYLVYDGGENGPYDSIEHPLNVGGKLAYEAKKGDKWFVIMEK